MGKYSLGAATTEVQSTVSKDVLYLDPEKANALEADMITQLNGINKSLNNLYSSITKAVNKKIVTGDYASAFTGWGKKCKSQATAAQTKINTLKSKYDADVKDYTIKLLSDRITALEEKISTMNG